MLQDVAFDFAQLSFTYPFLGKQRGKLSLDRIFSARKNFQVRLKHPFLGPSEGPQGFLTFNEKMSGTTTVTFKRLKD
ncbi:MAG TPA: hypothetical protein VES62_04785 [Thermoleophilaceae bacterium]|nr:hypothetical protein [Thermoleophilaceae bacterium]